MSLRHSIVGSEAFAYADRGLAPAHGSIQMFRRTRRGGMPRWFWPSLGGSLVMLLMAIGKTVSSAG